MNTEEETSDAIWKLRDFAWKVAGPREFFINVILNAALAWICYWKADYVTIAGAAPILAYLGPMSFLLPLLTTFFGYMNGVIARRNGIGPPWPEGLAWKKRALLAGLLRGVLLCPISISLGLAFHHFLFDGKLPLFAGMTAIGLIAGIAGYLLHAWAIECAGRLETKSQKGYGYRTD